MRAQRTLVELLQAMVRIDSSNPATGGPPAGQAQLAEMLDRWAVARGLATRRQDLADGLFNLMVWHQVNVNAPWIAFDSHLDTVTTNNMTIDPLAAVICDGRLYGRGACDTKASGAAMLTALDQYREDPPLEGGNNVVIVFPCDEEVAKTGVTAVTAGACAALPSGVPALTIVGEPTALQPAVATGGVVRWKISTHGVAAHSSDPSAGRSAISMMVKVLEAIETRYIPSLSASHPLIGNACCSVNLIRGGTAINIVPDLCEIHVDRRVVPGEDAATVLPAVEAVLSELCTQWPGLRVEQSPAFVDPPLDDQFSRDLLPMVQCVLKQKSLSETAFGVRYGTDASQYAIAGAPAIVLGPGQIEQAHTADEWIELAQVSKAADVYLEIMRASLPPHSDATHARSVKTSC